MQHTGPLQFVAVLGFCLAANLVFIEPAFSHPALQDVVEASASPAEGSPAGLIRRAESGDKVSQYRLALAYQEGRGVDKNYAEALKWHSRSANQGFPAAQHALGWIYEHGFGLPPDPVQASQWYRAAAEQGFPAAQNCLGHMYFRGQGVPHDQSQAVYWYRKAA